MKIELDMSIDDLKMLRAVLQVRKDREIAAYRTIMQTAVEQMDQQLYPNVYKHFCTRGNHTWTIMASQDPGPYDLLCPTHEQEQIEEEEMMPDVADETEAPK